MAFENHVTLFNFRHAPTPFCGHFTPFFDGHCHHAHKPLNFGQSFLLGFSMALNPFCNPMRFMGFNNCSPFNQPFLPYGNGNFYNQLPFAPLPRFNAPSIQELWSLSNTIKDSQPKFEYNVSQNPQQLWKSAVGQKSYQFNPTSWNNKTFSSKTSNSRNTSTSYNKPVNGTIDHSYANLSKAEAEKKAQNDSRLERLSGGQGWSLANTFETDIPYAKKGTSEILTRVAELVGENLVITSALGTAGTSKQTTPHEIGGYVSHHNAENPKLDIDCRDNAHVKQLAQKLEATGYFSHIHQHATHIDVQIDPNKFKKGSLSVVA